MEGYWDKYKHLRRVKPPVQPYTTGDQHPMLSADGKVVGVSDQEAREVQDLGYRKTVGEALCINGQGLLLQALILLRLLRTRRTFIFSIGKTQVINTLIVQLYSSSSSSSVIKSSSSSSSSVSPSALTQLAQLTQFNPTFRCASCPHA
jgi:hypothetical protein